MGLFDWIGSKEDPRAEINTLPSSPKLNHRDLRWEQDPDGPEFFATDDEEDQINEKPTSNQERRRKRLESRPITRKLENIAEWHPWAQQVDSPTRTYCGPRRRGKTTMMIWENYYRRKVIDFGLGMSGDGDPEEDFPFLPEDYVIKGWRPELVLGLQDRQRRIKQLTNKPERQAIWLDDIMGNNDVRYDPTYTELCARGRHMFIETAVCLQDAIGQDPTQRANSDYYYIFNQPNMNRIRLIGKELAIGEIADEWENFVEAYTNGIGKAIVVKNCEVSYRAEDKYALARCPPRHELPNYKVFAMKPAEGDEDMSDEDE